MKVKIEKKEDLKKGDIFINSDGNKRKVLEIYNDLVFVSQYNNHGVSTISYLFSEIIKKGYFKEIPDYVPRSKALEALHNGKRVRENENSRVYYYDEDGLLRYNGGHLSITGLPYFNWYEII